MIGKNRNGQQRRVLCAGFADSECTHWNSTGHLHRREQRIETFERLALHRNAQNGQRGISGNHSGQMRGASRGGDDDLEPICFSLRSKFRGEFRGAMRREHAVFMRYRKILERIARGAHDFPIGLAAHDDGDQGSCSFAHVSNLFSL